MMIFEFHLDRNEVYICEIFEHNIVNGNSDDDDDDDVVVYAYIFILLVLAC